MNKFYFIIITRMFYMYISTYVGPGHKKNILNFGYGICYKYEGILS